MPDWRSITLNSGDNRLRERLREACASAKGGGILLDLEAESSAPAEAAAVAGLADQIIGSDTIIAAVAGGALDPLTFALILSADIAFARRDLLLTPGNLPDAHLPLIAQLCARILPKTKAMAFFIEPSHDALSLLRLGVVSRILDDGAAGLAQARAILKPVKPEALLHLKRLWRGTSSCGAADALAAERLEFSKCFARGAAGDIAAWLRKRFNTSAEPVQGESWNSRYPKNS